MYRTHSIQIIPQTRHCATTVRRKVIDKRTRCLRTSGVLARPEVSKIIFIRKLCFSAKNEALLLILPENSFYRTGGIMKI